MFSRAILIFFMVFFVFTSLAFSASVTGTLSHVNFENGMFVLKVKRSQVGFMCKPEMLVNLRVGDKIKVEYMIEDGAENVHAVDRVVSPKTSRIEGQIVFIDYDKGFLTVKDEYIELGLVSDAALLKNYKKDDHIEISYVIDGVEEVVKSIKKK